MSRVLIGLCGPAGVGKSTAVQYIPQGRVIPLSFAAPLRAMLAAVIPECAEAFLSREQAHKCLLLPSHWEQATGWRTVRDALVGLGTHCIRANHPHFWLAAAESALHEAGVTACLRFGADTPYRIVYDDCRFSNETAWLRSKGASIVHLHRNGAQYTRVNAAEHGPGIEVGDWVLLGEYPPEYAGFLLRVLPANPEEAEAFPAARLVRASSANLADLMKKCGYLEASP